MAEQRIHRKRELFFFLLACYSVATVAALMTRPEIQGWYASLAKPDWRPPNWLFGPVWTILYGMIAVAGWRIWRTLGSKARTISLIIFWVQLGLNFLWSPTFFNLHKIGLAALIIVCLWAAALAFVIVSWNLDRLAAYLFLPYIAWVGFASVLNYTIWTMNETQSALHYEIPTAYALRLKETPGTDGFPTLASWQTARPISFAQDWRGENKDPQRSTEVRLLWTPEMLFLRFEVRYRSLNVFGDAREDGWRYELWDKDVAEAFLQPDATDPLEYQELEVAPNGFWIDLHISRGAHRELHSRLVRRAKINENAKIWTAELAVPMQSLVDHFDPASRWRANFYRVEGEQEPRFYSAWSATRTEKPNFHVPAAFGWLVFI